MELAKRVSLKNFRIYELNTGVKSEPIYFTYITYQFIEMFIK